MANEVKHFIHDLQKVASIAESHLLSKFQKRLFVVSGRSFVSKWKKIK